jgi:AraC-like DNA-binding protein
MEPTQPTQATQPAHPALAFIPARHYARLLDVLVERGHSREAVLASVGLGHESFGRDAGYLSLQQMEALVKRACALEPDRHLGLDVGRRISLMSHGALSVAVLSAATLGDALEVVAECFALACPLFALALRSENGMIALRLERKWALSPEVERYHTAAMCASLHAHVPGLLFGGALPSGLEIDSPHPRPAGLPRWLDEVGVTFERPHHELRGPSALLSVRLPLADPRVHRDAVQKCRTRLAARPSPFETAATVRRVLMGSGPPFLDLVGTAKRLATSSRSLRRRLRDEGTSFRSLLDEVRSTIADRWLEDPRRSITEIGLDLGYTDAANFARAYRRANGVSPSVARKQRRGLLASASP